MRCLLLSLWLLLLPVLAQAQINQRDWALQLIDSLGWSYGLPEQPSDADYAQLLSGNRVYRIEAEKAFQPGDRVAVMKFNTFGVFSGAGWLNGVRVRTTAHLKFNLPHAGHYKLKARVRLSGHHLRFGQRDFRLDGGPQFTDVVAGYLNLEAGPQEAILQLSPNGSVDYFELEADPLGPIVPAGGWKFDAQLTAEDVAHTVVQALNLRADLPADSQVLRFEAENLPRAKGVRIYTGGGLGRASGGRYLQVGAAPVKVSFLVTSPPTGFADLVLRAAGPRPIKVKLPGYFVARKQFRYQFEDQLLGTYFSPPGELKVEVQLPPGSALDSFELRSRRSSRADLLRLVGLPESASLTPQELNNLSALISHLKALRQ